MEASLLLHYPSFHRLGWGLRTVAESTHLKYEYRSMDDLDANDRVSAWRIAKLLEHGPINLCDLWSGA